jgi:hypothetical protein
VGKLIIFKQIYILLISNKTIMNNPKQNQMPSHSPHIPLWVYALFVFVLAGSVFALSSDGFTGMASASTTELEVLNQEPQPVIQEEVEPEQGNNLIQLVLTLRKSTNDNNLIQIARNYDALDKTLTPTQHVGLWRIVADCSYNSCDDKAYLNLINSIALSSNTNKDKLISQSIRTAYLWEGRNEALFSESLTVIDDSIRKLDENIISSWDKYLNCNCPGKYSELFVLINELSK